MSKSTNKEYATNLELYEKMVATNANVDRKGKTMPYTSLNGHMFSFLTKEGRLALRLPAGERESFLERYDTELCVQYGRVMKEYVLVPETLLGKTNELKVYFDLSYQKTGMLKPKPTKKKK